MTDPLTNINYAAIERRALKREVERVTGKLTGIESPLPFLDCVDDIGQLSERVYGLGFAVGDRVVITAVVNSVERWAVGRRGTVRYVGREGAGGRRRLGLPREAVRIRVEVQCPEGYNPTIRELVLTNEHVRPLDVIEQIGELPT